MWKVINEYPNYLVNEEGVVVRRETFKRMGVTYKNRYGRVKLSRDGVAKRVYVHRLVATAFIENPQNLPCVNHKDGDPTNNSVDNLEWCTHSYNSIHANRTGLRKHPLTESDVNYIRENYIPRTKGHTQHELADIFGVSQQTISDILLNKYWILDN